MVVSWWIVAFLHCVRQYEEIKYCPNQPVIRYIFKVNFFVVQSEETQ